MQAKNFRTSLGTVALVLGVALLASPAFAQVAFTATSFAQNVRVEGQNETVGAIPLTSSGGGTIASGSSVIVTYGAPIAVTSGSVVATGTHSNGVFALTEGGSSLSIGFSSGTQDILSAGAGFAISQVRLNVAGSSFATPGAAINATLSGTAPSGQQITFTTSTVQVALVNSSLSVKFNGLSNAFTTCSVATGQTFTIDVTEKFPAALTSLSDEQGFTPSGNVPGSVSPTQGSSIVVAFSGVPNGMGISTSGAASTAPPSFGAPTSAFQASTANGSTLTFSFPVTNTSTAIAEKFTLTFNVGATNSAGTGLNGSAASIPVLNGTASLNATVSLGPVAATSSVISFVANTQASGTVATVGDCVTNLLFPFVTNQFGFDTSLQIANTTLDKPALGTSNAATAGSGTCVLTLYPTDLTTQTASAAGTQANASQLTTPSITSGAVYTTAMSTAFPGQSGYMFAVCRFLDAHGFSYVTNGPSSTATISQGLLALVIPSANLGTSGSRTNVIPVNLTTTVTTYESLGH